MTNHVVPKSLLQRFVKMSHIDSQVLQSVERNIRACYPKLPENDLERMVIRNLTDNLDSCSKTSAGNSPAKKLEQIR